MPSSGIAQPETLTLRPLTGGMVTDKSSLQMPAGTVRNARGFDIRANGPRRVDGRVRMVPESVPFWFPTETVSDVASYWGMDDKQFTVAITNRALYKVEYATPDGYYGPVFYQRNYTASGYVSGTGVITLNTYNAETEGIRMGDYVVLALTPTVKRIVTAVLGSTVTIATGLTIADGAAFNIYRPFECAEPYYVDYAVYARATIANMILVDGSHDGIYSYNGGFLKPFPLHFPGTPDTAAYTAARTVMYFGGRLYFGCVELLGATYRQRLVWTEVLDLQETPTDAYQDLDETPGQILKLVGLGSLAFCYMNDAAYYGRQTNLAGLPYAFTKLDTGGIGLVGQRAACPFFDGQVFVSSDEIYFITASGGIQALGTPVMLGSVDKALQAGSLQHTVVRVDIARQRILFGFSLNGSVGIDAIYAYNYVTKAWSYAAQAPVTTFNVVNFADEKEYDDYGAGDTYAVYAGVTYTAFGGNFADRQLTFADTLGDLYVLSEGTTLDELVSASNQPILAVIETGDFDLDQPDTDKTCMELRVKINSGEFGRSNPVVFTVAGSVDRGVNWKPCGSLAIPLTKSEGAAGFRLTGAHFRFRLTSASVVEPYEINEITIRAVLRGVEGNRGNTTSNP